MGYYDKKKSSYKRDYGFPEYVPVAERKLKATKQIDSLKKKGKEVNPVVINGRKIATTFWGKAWCDNLEAYSDYSNRLPCGRTDVRNGSVIDLQVTKGLIEAQVMGSSLYRISITLKPTPEPKWQSLVKSCAGKIDSLIELLQGKFSKSVMEIITKKEGGLFPNPKEISMKCSCPDSAGMCKHIAAVLYGVGAILDSKPEWLFLLRHVDHLDLISSVGSGSALIQNQTDANSIDDNELASLFGIEMDGAKDKTDTFEPVKKTQKNIRIKTATAKPKASIPVPAVKPKPKTKAKAKPKIMPKAVKEIGKNKVTNTVKNEVNKAVKGSVKAKPKIAAVKAPTSKLPASKNPKIAEAKVPIKKSNLKAMEAAPVKVKRKIMGTK